MYVRFTPILSCRHNYEYDITIVGLRIGTCMCHNASSICQCTTVVPAVFELERYDKLDISIYSYEIFEKKKVRAVIHLQIDQLSAKWKKDEEFHKEVFQDFFNDMRYNSVHTKLRTRLHHLESVADIEFLKPNIIEIVWRQSPGREYNWFPYQVYEA